MEEQTNNIINQNIYCKHCGSQNSSNSNFCSNCGNSLKELNNQNNVATNIANYVSKDKVQLFSQSDSQDIVQSNVQNDIQNSFHQNNDIQDNMQDLEIVLDEDVNNSSSRGKGILGILSNIAIFIGALWLGGIVLLFILFGACAFLFG